MTENKFDPDWPHPETIGERTRTHGHTIGRLASPTYRSWCYMKARCLNPNASPYHKYGARGVAICDRWRNSFEAFLEDMGERPDGMSLDRIDNNKGYEPGNCRWATPKEQAINRRTSRQVLRSDGAIFPSITEAAESVGCERRKIARACSGFHKTKATIMGFSWTYLEK